MNISELAEAFFRLIDRNIGPFDRPIHFHPFPFDAGGNLNFLTIRAQGAPFVTCVSWDLFGHRDQKRGSLGRYELLAVCDKEDWCQDALTKIGRQSLQVVIEPGDTLDIGPWVEPDETIQGIVFEEAFSAELQCGKNVERCGLLRCVGVTRSELQFALNQGTGALMKALRASGIYPRTIIGRDSINLTDFRI